MSENVTVVDRYIKLALRSEKKALEGDFSAAALIGQEMHLIEDRAIAEAVSSGRFRVARIILDKPVKGEEAE